MRVKVAGLDRAELIQYIHKHFPEIKVVRSNPEFVLCYGGDGTLLYAERQDPGIPKVMIRNSRICHNCARVTREIILTLLTQGKYELTEHPLLEARIHDTKLLGLNDIIIAHSTINSSLRYNVYLNGAQYGAEYLGDGVIVATPLGSTGYFQSVTQSTFQNGLGIAFNNTVNIIGHLVVNADTEVRIQVNRGPGLVVADNDQQYIRIDKRQSVIVRQSHISTYMVYFKGKKYRQYNVGLGENRVPLGYCQVCSKRIG